MTDLSTPTGDNATRLRARAQTWWPGLVPLIRFLFGAGPARWLGPILYPYLRPLVGLLGLGLIAAGLGLVPPYLSKLVIDRGLMAGNVSALIHFSALLFMVGLMAVALGAVNNFWHMRVSVRMLADLRAGLLAALIARPSSWAANQRAGELLARVDGDASEVQKFAFNVVLGGLSSFVRLIGGAAMLMVLNWKLGLIAAALAPIELLFLIWARPRTTALASQVRNARGHLTAGLAESLHSLAALRVAKGQTWARARSLGDQADLNDQLIVQQRWLELTRAVPQILSAIMRAVIFVIGGMMVIRGDWPLGSLIAFIAYMGFMIGPMQSLLGLWHAQARARVALGRLDTLMGQTSDSEPPIISTTPTADLRLRNIPVGPKAHASYRSKGLHLDLAQGQKLALTGHSGVGKTSILMLISGQEVPSHGEVLLGGNSPATQPHRIGFVTQRPLILRASLRDNLFLPGAFWADSESEARVWYILDALGLAERFRTSPASRENGLDTMLGEQGLTLSGGERQRICLARVLLRPFDLLILDEALSEVDNQRVAQIMRFIDQEFALSTRIVTAHGDLAAYGPFDHLVDLSEGAS